MKRIYWVLVLILSIIFVFSLYGLYDQGKKIYFKNDRGFGAGFIPTEPITLTGTSVTNPDTLPQAYALSNTTTTDSRSNFSSDGVVHTINQLVSTNGMEGVYLSGVIRSRTATSVFAIYPQISYDGTNFVDIIGSATTTSLGTGTTTIEVNKFIYSFTPGLVTSNFSTPLFNTLGAKFTRFIFWGTNIDTDPTDGIDAFIQAVGIEKIVR